MSEVLPAFRLIKPTTVEEAIAALEQDTTSRICAGGTDLLVNMRRGLVETEALIDVTSIADLKRLEFSNSGLFIGAGVSLRELAENEAISQNYFSVTQACLSIAGPSHREAATVGGNLCLDTRCLYYNQSHWWRKANDFCLKYKGEICHVAPTKKQCRAAFSGDLAPALMVHRAEVEIASPNGRRRILLKELYNEDGMDCLNIKTAEIITGVHLPPAKGTSGYKKVRIRGAIDFPLAGVAVSCENPASPDCRFTIAVTGTNSCPVMVDLPDTLGDDDEPNDFFTNISKQVQKTVTPLRTTTTAAHYRRISVSAIAKSLAKELWNVSGLVSNHE
jgi:4-hydroxybenzoyl-CoA reductase subunit beta